MANKGGKKENVDKKSTGTGGFQKAARKERQTIGDIKAGILSLDRKINQLDFKLEDISKVKTLFRTEISGVDEQITENRSLFLKFAISLTFINLISLFMTISLWKIAI